MDNPNIPSQNHETGRQSAETSSATKEYQEELATLAVTTETTRSTKTLNQEIQAQEGGADQTQTPETTQTPEVLGNGESTLTFELLNGTDTKDRLLGIIADDSFKDLIPQGQVDSAERRLDLLFQRINGLINTYIERQFNFSKEQMEACPVLKKSLIPAIEWYLLDMLKGEADKNGDKGGNEANNTALDLFNNAKFNDIKGIWETISKFSNGSKYLYGKLKKLQRAIDFLVIHKDILGHADHYKELANPYLCMKYLSNSIWEDQKTDNLFPHPSDPNNPNSTPIEITPKDVGLTLKTEAQEIGMTETEKENLIGKIGNIEVVKNERTTKNIVKALEKAEQFMGTTNTLKDGVIQTLQNLNEPLNLLSQFGIGIESIPTDGIVGGIMNFFLSAMGVPFGVEGLQRERALANVTYHTPEIVEDEIDDAGENGGGTGSTGGSGGGTGGGNTPSSNSEQIKVGGIDISPYKNEMEKHMSSAEEITAFTQKVSEVAKTFDVPYQRILHLIHKTSGFDPKHQEGTGDEGTTGIFNLPNKVIRDTLKSTPEEFAKKSAADQLAMFETMFSDEKGKIKEYADLALLNFNPKAFEEKDNENYVVCTSPVEMSIKDFKDLVNDKFKKEVPKGTPSAIT